MIGIAIALLLVAAIASATAYYLGGSRSPAAAAPAVKVEAPIFVALEPFTVNLRQDERERFLHIGVMLKVSDIRSQARITEYLPEARSRILLMLANRQPDSLVTAEDKKQLAAEILKTLNQPFSADQPAQHITDVLFTAFVVQ
jgi:flagellar FliL protein